MTVINDPTVHLCVDQHFQKRCSGYDNHNMACGYLLMWGSNNNNNMGAHMQHFLGSHTILQRCKECYDTIDPLELLAYVEL